MTITTYVNYNSEVHVLLLK